MRTYPISCTLAAAALGLILALPTAAISASGDDATRPSMNSDNQPGGSWNTSGGGTQDTSGSGYGSSRNQPGTSGVPGDMRNMDGKSNPNRTQGDSGGGQGTVTGTGNAGGGSGQPVTGDGNIGGSVGGGGGGTTSGSGGSSGGAGS